MRIRSSKTYKSVPYADMYTMYPLAGPTVAEQLAGTVEAGGVDSICLKNVSISSHCPREPRCERPYRGR